LYSGYLISFNDVPITMYLSEIKKYLAQINDIPIKPIGRHLLFYVAKILELWV